MDTEEHIRELLAALMSDMDKPDRLPSLYEVHDALPGEVFWPVFIKVWRNSESCCLHIDSVHQMVDYHRDSPHRLLCMTPKEQVIYATFAERQGGLVRVYRGATSKRGGDGNIRGVSWTLSRAKAEWFAKRYGNPQPVVVTGEAKHSDVLLYLDGDEQEVLIEPARVRILTVDKLEAQTRTFRDSLALRAQMYGTTLGDTVEEEELERARLAWSMYASKHLAMTLDGFVESFMAEKAERCRALGFTTYADRVDRVIDQFLDNPELDGFVGEGTGISLDETT